MQTTVYGKKPSWPEVGRQVSKGALYFFGFSVLVSLATLLFQASWEMWQDWRPAAVGRYEVRWVNDLDGVVRTDTRTGDVWVAGPKTDWVWAEVRTLPGGASMDNPKMKSRADKMPINRGAEAGDKVF